MKSEDKIIDKLFSSGAHFGYSRARWHPSVKPFIYGIKNRSQIIDLEKTAASLKAAEDFARELMSQSKTILLVGSKKETQEKIMETATRLSMPYVTERWLGGTLTNFVEIKKRIIRLKELTEMREKGETAVYTKKERLNIDKEITKLERYFNGIKSLSAMPKALLVIDSEHENVAVAEAQKTHIPIISLSNSDCDITGIDYPVVANDSSPSSINLFLESIAEACEEGKKAAALARKEAETETETKAEEKI